MRTLLGLLVAFSIISCASKPSHDPRRPSSETPLTMNVSKITKLNKPVIPLIPITAEVCPAGETQCTIALGMKENSLTILEWNASVKGNPEKMKSLAQVPVTRYWYAEQLRDEDNRPMNCSHYVDGRGAWPSRPFATLDLSSLKSKNVILETSNTETHRYSMVTRIQMKTTLGNTVYFTLPASMTELPHPEWRCF